MENSQFRSTDEVTEGHQRHQRTKIVLDPYICDLNLNVVNSGYVGTPLTNGGFSYLWAGVRATHGFKSGQVCFAVRILEYLEVSNLSTNEPNPHVLRIGYSCKCASLQLGEEPFSWGYGGTGKTSVNGNYSWYGSQFSEGDIITAFLDFQRNEVVISFAVNGIHHGVAYKIPKNDLNGRALFPHVLTKNCQFEVNFGQKPKFVPRGFEDFQYPNQVSIRHLERGYFPPRRMEDCEFLMMCGLPGSGKTTWVQRECQKHPEKCYNVLGTDTIMNNMKVFGVHENYRERFDALYKPAENCLAQLLEIASRRKRNYILDQTNVYASARVRKMGPFPFFRRVAVVVVPSEEVFVTRLACQRRGGKIVPENVILNMKGNFSIPSEDESFDEIRFTDLQARNAMDLVFRYNQLGRGSGMHRPTVSVEQDVTSSMANLNISERRSNNFCRSNNRNIHGGRGQGRGGNTQKNMEDEHTSASQRPARPFNPRGRRFQRRPNYGGRGPQRAVSTSAIYEGFQAYGWMY